MKPLVTFPDVQAAGVRILRDTLATRDEPYADGVAVGARVPSGRSDDDPQLPYVLVANDSGPTRWPVSASTTLRVTVWHRTTEDAYDLAALCHGLLHAAGHGHGIRAVMSSGSSFPTVDADPDTANPLASFTATVSVRPVRVG